MSLTASEEPWGVNALVNCSYISYLRVYIVRRSSILLQIEVFY